MQVLLPGQPGLHRHPRDVKGLVLMLVEYG
ncbi:hypothetical protein HMPREF1487_04420 [Pseudomonas sp. HPB0071]|uniref:Uncharacterized protein n=2 Tax=Pseudomonas TaxID=286 RepID=A0A2X2ELY2_PSELU|nr:hypothetical protein HMPREF1487_04420 [Pseudomonas sp. HPB0071]SEQ25379.1 hypothetical protein SAMN05216409_104434 [Pseudomonas lutea]SHJ22850.1 hypothetical protein SAMN05216295_109150 [Pseudomonas zeshuii]SPZ07680.1 Uncharacterised protein [Pseudomonas luteola]